MTEEIGKKLGVCNYCSELGPVYEQENESRPLFLVCSRCIGDILQSFEITKRRKQIRRRLQWGDSSEV